VEQLEPRDQPAPLALGAGAPILSPVTGPATTTLVAEPTNQNSQQIPGPSISPFPTNQNVQQNSGGSITAFPPSQNNQNVQQVPGTNISPFPGTQNSQQNPGISVTPFPVIQNNLQNPGVSITPTPAQQPFLTAAAAALLTNPTTALGTVPAQTGLLANQTTLQNPSPGVSTAFPNQGSIGPAFNNQNGQQSPLLGLVPFQSSQGPTRGLPAPFAMLGSGGTEKPQNRTAERPSSGQEQGEEGSPEEPVEPGADMTLLLLDSQFRAEIEG